MAVTADTIGGGYDGDGRSKHTCCGNILTGVQPTPQRTTGQLSSDRPRGRRPQKDIGKSCHHSHYDMMTPVSNALMKPALHASQDRLMSSVIVLWSKWPHLSSKQPRGASTTKDAAPASSSTQFSQNRCLVHSSVGPLGHRSVQVLVQLDPNPGRLSI